ncbi:hypothetical protein [Mycobacteroides abscessus]|uniref:hypothetical protein n=1 Tax=Mycobacteroides abscessus TaxID=36809 RepID=UPI0003135C0F|nr:hypothetical protein [Mycobacteroides abscessus]
MTFVLPDPLPKGAAELDALRTRACRELEVFKARQLAAHEFTVYDVQRVEYLLASRDKIDAVMRSRLSRHEAGHAAMAVLMGGQVASAEVLPIGTTDDDGRRGVCHWLPTNFAVKQRRHLVVAAGCCAEAVWEHGTQASVAHVDAKLAGKRDGEFLRHWALSNSSPSSSSPTSEALPLVRRIWPAIESLATRIEEHGEISHKHVVRALGLSHDYNRHAFELNSIRSGLRPIPDLRATK